MRTSTLLVSLVLTLSSTAATAGETVDGRWSEVARARDGDCRMTITGNGRFYRVAATGLAPGERGRFVLTNGGMTPLDWSVRADAGGGFARYYLPFRWHRAGDTVAVALDTPSCGISASFDWRRAEPVVR